MQAVCTAGVPGAPYSRRAGGQGGGGAGPDLARAAAAYVSRAAPAQPGPPTSLQLGAPTPHHRRRPTGAAWRQWRREPGERRGGREVAKKSRQERIHRAKSERVVEFTTARKLGMTLRPKNQINKQKWGMNIWSYNEQHSIIPREVANCLLPSTRGWSSKRRLEQREGKRCKPLWDYGSIGKTGIIGDRGAHKL